MVAFSQWQNQNTNPSWPNLKLQGLWCYLLLDKEEEMEVLFCVLDVRFAVLRDPIDSFWFEYGDWPKASQVLHTEKGHWGSRWSINYPQGSTIEHKSLNHWSIWCDLRNVLRASSSPQISLLILVIVIHFPTASWPMCHKIPTIRVVSGL